MKRPIFLSKVEEILEKIVKNSTNTSKLCDIYNLTSNDIFVTERVIEMKRTSELITLLLLLLLHFLFILISSIRHRNVGDSFSKKSASYSPQYTMLN